MEDEIYDVIKDISGFKSAQQNTIESSGEYVYDLVAQYVMFGKVTFRVGNTFKTVEEQVVHLV